ncbi:MAG: SirB1 family protein, partial [Gammaproteobacteria bacterium]
MFVDPKVAFRDQIALPEDRIDLLLAALLIAADEDPKLDISHYVSLVNGWCSDIRRKLPRRTNTESLLQHLNRFLFEELGFAGDMDNYYHLRNSLINEVIDRRKGIPITLSMLYMELGQCLGLRLSGVSFPGHFLVKLPYKGGEVVLDPFNRGVSLSEDDLHARLREQFDTEVSDFGPLLSAASKKDILYRLLNNLKAIYTKQEAFEKNLAVMNKILIVNPELGDEYRDRGLLLHKLECHNAALNDLSHYLNVRP